MQKECSACLNRDKGTKTQLTRLDLCGGLFALCGLASSSLVWTDFYEYEIGQGVSQTSNFILT